MSNLGTTIKSIQDILRKDAGVDGDAQRISQLVWMLFLKVFDDREAEKEMMEERYKSPIPERLRWRSWAKDAEGITGDELLDFVNVDLFKTLKELPVTGKHGKVAAVVRAVFEDAFNYMKSGTLMRQVINKLEEIDFNRADDRHHFGDIYEKILSDLQGAGNAGEFYTPRAVTQFIVDQLDPKLGETFLDPACGTGGFLTCAIEHVRRKYVKGPEHEAVLQTSVLGIEKKQMPHLLCVTNMMFHGIDVPSNVQHDNTLARPLRDYGPKDRVDVIGTNPPFGGMEEDGIELNFPQAFRTRETADLFLVLLMTLLKPGGRAGLVLPDGTLFGEGVKTRIKEKLLEECNLHTVVRCPRGCSTPTRASRRTCSSSPRATRRRTCGSTSTPCPRGRTTTRRASRSRSRSSTRRRSGGGSGRRTTTPGRCRSRTSRRGGTTSTSRIRGPRRKGWGIRTRC